MDEKKNLTLLPMSVLDTLTKDTYVSTSPTLYGQHNTVKQTKNIGVLVSLFWILKEVKKVTS